MKRLVMIVSDLYLAQDAARVMVGRSSQGLARFGAPRALPEGWRSWLATRLGFPDLGTARAAAVAAAAFESMPVEGAAPVWVWLVDPVHLNAGPTGVHLTARLRLDAAEQDTLCREFDEQFATTGYRLLATRCGRFLALGPAEPVAIKTRDPAQWLGSRLTEAFPASADATGLHRLGAEIEMWLHEHPVNVQRLRAGRLQVSALWMWAGGAPLEAPSMRADVAPPALQFFAEDAYLEGLSRLLGVSATPAPSSLAALGPVPAGTTVIQLELWGAIGAQPDSRAEMFEHDWVAPALERLDERDIERLVVVAGDRLVALNRRDGWKYWRKPRSVLSALRDA